MVSLPLTVSFLPVFFKNLLVLIVNMAICHLNPSIPSHLDGVV
ncbi:hypothetical protein Tco_0589755, partial [Tanacetum coccineum]